MRLRLWRRLSARIVAASILCGIVGFLSLQLTGGFVLREAMMRSTIPVLSYLWTQYEHTRCEADPAAWTLSLTPGASAFAYDGDSRRSPNPAAPPLDVDLLDAVPAPPDVPVAVRVNAWRGGAAVMRSGARGPCAIVQTTWTPRLPAPYVVVAALPGTLAAAALGFFFVVRPLTTRIARLRGAAEQVGHTGVYASAERDAHDELGEVSASLDKAHARIVGDTERIEQRRLDLQRHLDDVTHDLRTPLASLQIALEQAADATVDESVRELVGSALRDAVYLGALTSNLRLASQLREGWDPLASNPTVDLCDIVARVASRARVFARRRGIALEVAVPDGELDVRCDSVAAEQAVTNIVENAIAYGEPGGHIAVVLDQEDASFSLVVEDDGPGVAPTELPRLGERTFRSDEARQRDPRGSGLGLAITNEVCARCGWKLSFEAAEPKGLRVSIRGLVLAVRLAHRPSAT
jgi:signal transduction histidine kinase